MIKKEDRIRGSDYEHMFVDAPRGTGIEWTNRTWNPVTGCSEISAGCTNCYARRMARRLAGRAGYPAYPNHFAVTEHPDRLRMPYGWKKPSFIFVCSMGDLFHEDVSDNFIEDVFDVIIDNPHHIFQVLTKRPERIWRALTYDIENLWLGVTVENQEAADERIPHLLKIEAPVRFLSVEPMLERVDILSYLLNPDNIHWVICGGETGHNSREMEPWWAWDLLSQCHTTRTPFFFKKPGTAANLNIRYPSTREFPEVV
jgi:protein gp37